MCFKTLKQWNVAHKGSNAKDFPGGIFSHRVHTYSAYKQQLTSAGHASRMACMFGKLNSRGCEVWTRRAARRQMQSDSLAGETLYISTKTQGEPVFSRVGWGGWWVCIYRLFVAASIYHSLLARYGDTEAAKHSRKKSYPIEIYRLTWCNIAEYISQFKHWSTLPACYSSWSAQNLFI